MKIPSNSSALLWIGAREKLHKQTEQYLQSSLCKKSGCNFCTTCTLIKQQQHPSCLWFNPENNYTLESLKPFFSTISRSLDADAQFFFIFCGIDYLSNACTNSLLKSIEEPPSGYQILFLAQNLQTIAPTLRSRCIITVFDQHDTPNKEHDLLSFFTQKKNEPDLFLQLIEKTPLDEKTSQELLQNILRRYSKEYTNALQEKKPIEALQQKLATVQKALEKPLMPGSAKIFWKNLFLKVNHL